MNTRDPKLTALQFNEYINSQDVDGLSGLMTDNHTFIDREGHRHEGREFMTEGWVRFFREFPEYRNTFTRVDSRDDLVILLGYAEWSRGAAPDQAIWAARIEDDRVAEWRIYHDTEPNRTALGVGPGS